MMDKLDTIQAIARYLGNRTLMLKLRQLRAKFIDKHIRKRQFKDLSISIISNNCWGSMTFYQRFGIKYNTPTVGLFISDTDFMKLCRNLRYYLSLDLKFIKPSMSPAFEEVQNWSIAKTDVHDYSFPVAMLDDVTIWFMHAKSEEDAMEKWERRKRRMSYDNIIVKWSQRYTQSTDIVNEFLQIPYRKLGFVDKECPINSTELYKIDGWNKLKEDGGAEISFVSERFNVIELINHACSQK